jgi:hypothetical protein
MIQRPRRSLEGQSDYLFPIVEVQVVEDDEAFGGISLQHIKPVSEWAEKEVFALTGGKHAVNWTKRPALYKQFIALASKSPESYRRFHSKYGTLVHDDFSQEHLRGRGHPSQAANSADPPYLHKEELFMWRWHVERLAFFQKLYLISKGGLAQRGPAEGLRRLMRPYFKLQAEGRLPFLGEALRYIDSWGFGQFHGIGHYSVRIAEKKDVEPVNAISSPVCYSPHHEMPFATLLDRDNSWRNASQVLSGVDSESLHRLLVHYSLDVERRVEDAIERICRVKVDVSNGIYKIDPRGVLGASMVQFAEQMASVKRLESRICPKCGRSFTPTNRRHIHCHPNCKQAMYHDRERGKLL